METITLNTIDNNITMVIKSEFASVLPEYKITSVKDLIEKHQVFKFFHNPNGPAVVDHKINQISYFLNGQLVEGEELEKIKHREQFNLKMDEVLHGAWIANFDIKNTIRLFWHNYPKESNILYYLWKNYTILKQY